MKRIEFEQLPKDVADLFVASQREKVVIARDGKPYALIVGVEFKDQEDLQLETSPEFWEMIRQRRAETSMISLEEFVAELKAQEDAAVNGAPETAANQQLQQRTEIREEEGRITGIFTPSAAAEDERLRSLFDLDEAERTLAEEKDQAKPLAEVWREIKARGTAG